MVSYNYAQAQQTPTIVYFFQWLLKLLTSFIGPEKNVITDVLMGIDWKRLAYQLKLEEKTCVAIEVGCSDENIAKAACYLRGLLREYINSQPYEPCNITVGKIAEALEDLNSINKATNLQKTFGIGIIIRILNTKSHASLTSRKLNIWEQSHLLQCRDHKI